MSGNSEDLELVDGLANILYDRGLQELEVKINRGDGDRISVRLARPGKVPATRDLPPGPVSTEPAEAVDPPESTKGEPNVAEEGVVKSEMVGIAYLKPSPDAAEPYVKIGSTVSEGDTLLIIEAMKTMNHIHAPRSGTVMKIFVHDQEPVQYGTSLMLID